MIVYCSIPAINRRDKALSEIQDQICLPHVTMDYHREHDKYTTNKVGFCDAIIVMHQNNQFDFLIDTLTDSVKKDIEVAKRLGKKIFLAYRTANGEVSIYETITSQHHMKGMPGSSRAIGAYLRDNDVDRFIAQSEAQYKAQQKPGQIGIQRSKQELEEDLEAYNSGNHNLPPVPTFDEKVAMRNRVAGYDSPKYDRRLLL